MNKNENSSCICEQGYDKGALIKTIENNVFTIYGNIVKNNHIVLRYHGKLIDSIDHNNYTNNLYISYYFNGNSTATNTIVLAKCNKCIGENYCALIPLEEHNSISFNFFVDKSSSTETEETSFNLNITKDPLMSVLEKYGIEENMSLPVCEQPKQMQIKKIISAIKNFFISFLKKDDDK